MLQDNTALWCSVATMPNDTGLQMERLSAGVTAVTCEELGKDTAALGEEYRGASRCADRNW